VPNPKLASLGDLAIDTTSAAETTAPSSCSTALDNVTMQVPLRVGSPKLECSAYWTGDIISMLPPFAFKEPISLVQNLELNLDGFLSCLISFVFLVGLFM
jgi:hypothetical protein